MHSDSSIRTTVRQVRPICADATPPGRGQPGVQGCSSVDASGARRTLRSETKCHFRTIHIAYGDAPANSSPTQNQTPIQPCNTSRNAPILAAVQSDLQTLYRPRSRIHHSTWVGRRHAGVLRDVPGAEHGTVVRRLSGIPGVFRESGAGIRERAAYPPSGRTAAPATTRSTI